MKKVLCIICLLCAGCQDPVTENVKENNAIIDRSKHAAAIHSTESLIKEAEMKYVTDLIDGTEKDCYSFDELSAYASITSGSVCYENNDYIAKNIYVNGYICSGTSNSVQCEAKNDK